MEKVVGRAGQVRHREEDVLHLHTCMATKRGGVQVGGDGLIRRVHSIGRTIAALIPATYQHLQLHQLTLLSRWQARKSESTYAPSQRGGDATPSTLVPGYLPAGQWNCMNRCW